MLFLKIPKLKLDKQNSIGNCNFIKYSPIRNWLSKVLHEPMLFLKIPKLKLDKQNSTKNGHCYSARFSLPQHSSKASNTYSVSILYGNIAILWSLEPFLAKHVDIASIQTLWEIIPLSSFVCLDNYLMVTVKKHQFEGINSSFKNLNF